jgi:hypothetical protein
VALDIAGGSFLSSNEIEADRLKEIENDQRLKLILADWQSRLRESQERKERKHTLSLNVKNEIYQLIGFFSVFQGVVLTTVSQASQLTCHNWWGPFALSLLASITTLFGVCNKFHNFIKWKRATDVEVENSKVYIRLSPPIDPFFYIIRTQSYLHRTAKVLSPLNSLSRIGVLFIFVVSNKYNIPPWYRQCRLYIAVLQAS